MQSTSSRSISESYGVVLDLDAIALSWATPCASVRSEMALRWPLSSCRGAFRRIKAALGVDGVIVSGGGSLAGHLDLFFEAIGMPLLNGWGLTETSPVLCCRLHEDGRNIRGSVGYPISGTEVRVVHPETLKDVEDGTSGVILARGPGVTKGYHNNPDETRRAILEDGWFNTGLERVASKLLGKGVCH